MAQPVWVTPPGTLGTIPEGIFYQIPLKAYDPNPLLGEDLYYVMIAGELPAGIQCTKTGLIIGVPQAITSLQGVPNEVSRDVTSKFAVRAYTEKEVDGREVITHVADRTFSLTVTGQNVPQFVTPAGNIGTYYDGSVISIQIEFTDTDPADTVVVQVAQGALPAGLTVSPRGLISGFIAPLVPPDGQPGFDRDGEFFDEYPFDFSTRSASTNYQFTLEITDGKSSNLRTFEIYVYSRDSLTADTTSFTADNTFITADETPIRLPFLVNALPSNLGTVRNDNFFAYQFVGLDLDGDQIEYWDFNDSSGLELPPGLQLDRHTGWLYGYIPNLGATELHYRFGLFVAKSYDPNIRSDPYYFTMSVVGAVDTDVTWLSPADLGTINNGATSLFKVEAVNSGGRSLQYQLRPGDYPVEDTGVYNKLPQGLQLLPSGDIAGRVSFNTFALDSGTTTFDKDIRTRLVRDETTFDMSFKFTVNAFSVDGLVSVFKTFTITVVRVYNEPYDNLYITAMPPESDRQLINQLIQNQDIIIPDLVYRPTDPNFGVATKVIYQHAYGLTAATYGEYVESLRINHYWKNLTLGSIETAQALDVNGNIIYEIVYSKVVDNLSNAAGIGVSKSVTLPYPVLGPDGSEIATVYPNSLPDMRDQVIDVVGKISNVLPLWMTSKQKNGQVLGFTPSWVICYCKPGSSAKIAYNIKTIYGIQLNKVDFEVDRYELDRLLSIHWDPIADSTGGAWVPTPAETTFDLVLHYRDTGITPGVGYKIGDKILILGSQVGGLDEINDVTITVQDINSSGGITILNLTGEAPLFSSGDTYSGVSGINLIGTGSGAEFNFVVSSGQITVFDGTSLRFEAPVDNYTNTDSFDKYLVFPKRTILA